MHGFIDQTAGLIPKSEVGAQLITLNDWNQSELAISLANTDGNYWHEGDIHATFIQLF